MTGEVSSLERSALAPSEKLRVALTAGSNHLTLNRAMAHAFLAENAALRVMVADEFAARAAAEARPILDRARRLLQRARREVRFALALHLGTLGYVVVTAWLAGWFG